MGGVAKLDDFHHMGWKLESNTDMATLKAPGLTLVVCIDGSVCAHEGEQI